MLNWKKLEDWIISPSTCYLRGLNRHCVTENNNINNNDILSPAELDILGRLNMIT